MRTVKTLRPGQKGTKELQKRFGPSLLLVRYRCDEDRREHVKTVELVVQRRSREGERECIGSRAPRARSAGAGSHGGRSPGARPGTRRVALRIGWRERDLQGTPRRWLDRRPLSISARVPSKESRSAPLSEIVMPLTRTG